MKTKKWLSVLLAMLLVFAMGAGALADVLERGLPYYGDPRIVPEGEEITLTIFQRLNDRVENLDAEHNAFTKMLEEATGVKLKFITAPESTADAKTKLNLLLNSGDYPDIISFRAGINRNEMAMYAEQGIFIALDEYLTDEIAPNAKEVFETNTAARIINSAADGMIYSLPDINDCYHCIYGNGRAWYYMPWMRDINNDVYPETTEELMDYLRYIRDNDVNGNGDPNDEIPLCFTKDDMDIFMRWLAGSFMIYPYEHYRLEDDGTITACFVEDDYKKALELGHQMYEEGLILEDSFSATINDLQNIGEDPSGNKYGLIVGWGPERAVVRGGESKRWYEYYILPPVAGPEGVRWANNRGDWASVAGGFYVTDACEYPEIAVALGDILLSYYYGYSSLIGLKGVSWDDPSTPDAVDFNGEPAMYREIVPGAAQPIDTSWNQMSITNRDVAWWMAREAEGADEIHAYLNGDFTLRDKMSDYGAYNEVMKYYGCMTRLDPYKFDEKYIVPSLLYDETMQDIVADANAVVEEYRKEMFAAFVTGTRSLDEYDDYVAEMYAMGLQDILDSQNTSYQAYMATQN